MYVPSALTPSNLYGLVLLTGRPVEPETAPSGMLARGHYNALSKFVDDDNHVHLQFKWSFDIKKDWN